MTARKAIMNLEISSLGEIKLVLMAWDQVITRHLEPEKLYPKPTEFHLVNVALEDRWGPEEVVVLQFVAPPEMLQALMDEMANWGFEWAVETIFPGFISRCRLARRGH